MVYSQPHPSSGVKKLKWGKQRSPEKVRHCGRVWGYGQELSFNEQRHNARRLAPPLGFFFVREKERMTKGIDGLSRNTTVTTEISPVLGISTVLATKL